MRTQQSGFTMIEVLVTIGILVVGLLGLAALQTLTQVAELESYQRSQAIVLVRDMADRITGNKINIAQYVGNDVGLAENDCTGLTGAALDLCEWGNLIRGSAERRGGAGIGAMLAARGCITRPATSTDRYTVSIAWQGILPTAGATSPCGSGDPLFPDETVRRAVSETVCIALLRDAASAPVLPRC